MVKKAAQLTKNAERCRRYRARQRGEFVSAGRSGKPPKDGSDAAIVLGGGTGRSGTTWVASQIAAQCYAMCTHEIRNSRSADYRQVAGSDRFKRDRRSKGKVKEVRKMVHALRQISRKSDKVACDISHTNTELIGFLLDRYPSAKAFMCLRDEEYIDKDGFAGAESFAESHMRLHPRQKRWENYMLAPFRDGVRSRKEMLVAYHSDVGEKAKQLQLQYPDRVMTLELSKISAPRSPELRQFLQWLGFARPRVVKGHKNAS